MTDVKDKRTGSQIYQEEICDVVFGEGAVKVKKSSRWNDFTIMLSMSEKFDGFKEALIGRLKRLKSRCEGTDQMAALLTTVAQMADTTGSERAYAKLAAWDVMWNNYLMLGMELNKKVGRKDVYASNMTGKLPVKDGYIEDSKLFFDVDALHFNGVDFGGMSEKDYDPYKAAERTKDMLLKRYAGNCMKDAMFIQVLVNSPYLAYNDVEYDMIRDDEYYELLAYYTFCDHTGDTTRLRTLVPGYLPGETVDEVSKSMAGFVVIDDGLNKDWHWCHVQMNPNAKFKNGLADFYLESLNCSRNDLGILGSFFDYMGWK